MAEYFASRNLDGFAHWMRLQADEEREHAMKFYNYILDAGGRVYLKAIHAPETDWKSNLQVAEQVAEETAATTRLQPLEGDDGESGRRQDDEEHEHGSQRPRADVEGRTMQENDAEVGASEGGG